MASTRKSTEPQRHRKSKKCRVYDWKIRSLTFYPVRSCQSWDESQTNRTSSRYKKNCKQEHTTWTWLALLRCGNTVFFPRSRSQSYIFAHLPQHFETKSLDLSTEDANCTWPENWAEWYPHPQSRTSISSQQGTDEKSFMLNAALIPLKFNGANVV